MKSMVSGSGKIQVEKDGCVDVVFGSGVHAVDIGARGRGDDADIGAGGYTGGHAVGVGTVGRGDDADIGAGGRIGGHAVGVRAGGRRRYGLRGTIRQRGHLLAVGTDRRAGQAGEAMTTGDATVYVQCS